MADASTQDSKPALTETGSQIEADKQNAETQSSIEKAEVHT